MWTQSMSFCRSEPGVERQMEKSCFGAYDIRGIYPAQVNEQLVYGIGRAFPALIKGKKIAVGRDVRLSGASLRDALVKGLVEAGAEVVDIGVVGTEMIYFAVPHLDMAGGIMITASHNPKEYNGMKFVMKDSAPLPMELFTELKNQVREETFPLGQAGGKVREMNVLSAYVVAMLLHIDIAELKPYKDQLTNMVPYRALAGFFTKCPERVNWDSIRRLVFYIDKFNREVTRLPYTLGESSRLNKEIYFDPLWIEMIQDNTVSILGWIQYEKVKWLQNNNPEVPGLVYKLAPMDDKMRKLTRVRKLWKAIMSEVPVKDIFSGEELNNNAYDVDHFVPWSFVMNDELWNLMPMQSGLNSVKSNKLPEWEPFFYRFADNQFVMYELISEKEGLRKLFERCYRDNLHSIWAGRELYIPGNSKETFCNILDKNMRPVYDSARRQGYEIWDYR